MHTTHFRAAPRRPRLEPGSATPTGRAHSTGVPAVAVDAEGRAHVFVGNARQRRAQPASRRNAAAGTRGRDLKGSEVHEELAAVTGESGRVELYGTNAGRRSCAGSRRKRARLPHRPTRCPGFASSRAPSSALVHLRGTRHAVLHGPERHALRLAPRHRADPACSRRPAPARRPCSAAPWTATTARCSPSVRPPAGSPSPPVRRSRSRRACGGRSPGRVPVGTTVALAEDARRPYRRADGDPPTGELRIRPAEGRSRDWRLAAWQDRSSELALAHSETGQSRRRWCGVRGWTAGSDPNSVRTRGIRMAVGRRLFLGGVHGGGGDRRRQRYGGGRGG